MVTKEELLRAATDAASAEAKRLGIDGDDLEVELLREKATSLIDAYFHGIEFDRAPRDSGRSDFQPAVSWKHLSEFDFPHVNFIHERMREEAHNYLGLPWMRSRAMDWVIADSLICAEYAKVWEQFHTDAPLPLSWGVISLLIAAALYFVNPWLILLVAIPAGAILWGKSRYQSGRAQALKPLADTYTTTATISQSWAIIWESLAESRKAGAVWDGVVYRLVEERMRGRA